MTLGLLLTKESTAWAAVAFDTSTPAVPGDGGEACTAAAVPAVTSATANTPAAVANRGENLKGAFFHQHQSHRGMVDGTGRNRQETAHVEVCGWTTYAPDCPASHRDRPAAMQ